VLAETASVGPVTAADLAAWERFVELDSGGRSALRTERKIEEIVLLRALAAAGPGLDDPQLREARAALAARVAETAARRAILASIRIPETELRAEFERRKESFSRPASWRLADLFLRVDPAADSATKAAVRDRLEALRARIVAGESFAALATAESESGTRLRGGAAGFVELASLRPELARVVATMKEGDLSPVLELPSGFVLLSCGGFDPAVEPSYEKVRSEVENGLRAARFESRWAELASSAPRPRDGEPPFEAAQRRADHFLAAARAAGGDLSDDDRLLTEWKEQEIRAQAAANRIAAAWIADPTAEEIAAAWGARRDQLVEPRSSRLRLLRLRLTAGTPRADVDAFVALGRELAERGGDLERAAAGFAGTARPEIEDLGWVGDDQIWALGLNAEAAWRSLRPGGFSPAVQEARALLILELRDQRPERRLELVEATATVRKLLLAERRSAASERLRKETLAAAGIRWLRPGAEP
jgi:hypothetical protein